MADTEQAQFGLLQPGDVIGPGAKFDRFAFDGAIWCRPNIQCRGGGKTVVAYLDIGTLEGHIHTALTVGFERFFVGIERLAVDGDAERHIGAMRGLCRASGARCRHHSNRLVIPDADFNAAVFGHAFRRIVAGDRLAVAETFDRHLPVSQAQRLLEVGANGERARFRQAPVVAEHFFRGRRQTLIVGMAADRDLEVGFPLQLRDQLV